jgi:hypothetical protein
LRLQSIRRESMGIKPATGEIENVLKHLDVDGRSGNESSWAMKRRFVVLIQKCGQGRRSVVIEFPFGMLRHRQVCGAATLPERRKMYRFHK